MQDITQVMKVKKLAPLSASGLNNDEWSVFILLSLSINFLIVDATYNISDASVIDASSFKLIILLLVRLH